MWVLSAPSDKNCKKNYPRNLTLIFTQETNLQGGSAEVELKKNQTFKLTTEKSFMEKGNNEQVFVDYDNISKVLKVGNRIFVDDGLMSLIVNDISKQSHFSFDR